MAVFTVTNLNDSGSGSLRQAIQDANVLGGADIIEFADDLNGGTITLETGELSITDSLTIQGNGSSALSISGYGSRIFNIDDTSSNVLDVQISGLTLTDGFAVNLGGAIRNENENLTLIDTVLTGNFARGSAGYFYTETSAYGGALWNSSGTVTIINSLISDNGAIGADYEGSGSGGGIYNQSGNLIIINSTISGNLTQGSSSYYNLSLGLSQGTGNASGGGITSGGSLTISNSIISNNSAIAGSTREYESFAGGSATGGGILAVDVTISNSIISDNKVIGGEAGSARIARGTIIDRIEGGSATGGGIRASNLTLNNSQISGNTAIGGQGGEGYYIREYSLYLSAGEGGQARGGGIEAITVTINNSTISTNIVQAGLDGNGEGNGVATGGGINGSNTTLTNSTITANTVIGFIGGTGAGVSGNATVTSTIIAGNTDNNDIAGVFTSGGNNLIGNADGATGFTNGVNGDLAGTSTAPIDPNLSPLQDNGGPTLTHIPLAGSPAIDSGSNPNNLVIDQRGAPRVVGGSSDIGAVEVTNTTQVGNNTSNSFSGTTGSDFLDGRSGNDALSGGIGNDAIRGGVGSDRLTGGDGNDVIIGGADRDLLLGGTGADIFLFESLTDSLITAPDRITDFNSPSGDRFLLLPTNPTGLFNAGAVVANSLDNALQAAYNDKNQAQSGSQALGAQEAVFFRFGWRTYLSINDNVTGFNPNLDLVAEVSGITIATGDQSAGILSLSNYFI